MTASAELSTTVRVFDTEDRSIEGAIAPTDDISSPNRLESVGLLYRYRCWPGTRINLW